MHNSLSKAFDLAGHTALVTGSSRGIGRAIALALAECGANLVVHGASRREEAQQVADMAARFGVTTRVVLADLAENDTPREVLSQAAKIGSQPDILVSSASIQIRKPWQEITRAEFDRQVMVNWRAAFELIQLTVPSMIERRWGRVLTVGSVQQSVPSKEMLVYAATKAAQLNMVQNLAKQVAPFGVTVNNLAPGLIDTERNHMIHDTPEKFAQVMARVPVGFIGQPADCVSAALVLCSDAGRYVTGADWYVDGGWSL